MSAIRHATLLAWWYLRSAPARTTVLVCCTALALFLPLFTALAAERVEAALPPTDAGRAAVDAVIPAAKDTYYAVFDGFTPIEQVTLQMNAERQGSMAWQNLKGAHPDLEELFDALTALELESADYLENVVLAS